MTNKELGDWGEDKAIQYLKRKTFNILETNWRFKKAEIDIISKEDNVLVFVEVKTRSNDYLGSPELSINKHKEELLYDAAGAYMELSNHDWEIRFDVISILKYDKTNFTIQHFEDAFYPEIQ